MKAIAYVNDNPANPASMVPIFRIINAPAKDDTRAPAILTRIDNQRFVA